MPMNPTVPKILLDRIPENERKIVLRALIASLPASNRLDLEFVASLAVSEADPVVKHDFINLLDSAIRDGEVQNAISICLQYPVFRVELLDRAAEHVSKAKSVASDQSQDHDAVQSYLQFSKSILSHTLVSAVHSLLVNSCLELMVSEDVQVAECSRDLVFAILATTDEKVLDAVILPVQTAIWKCIHTLISYGNNSPRSSLGYSLWLRWILSTKQLHRVEHLADDYWSLLMQGLRYGDSERRKVCLSILRLNTATDSFLLSSHESEQFQRYCTVFETIVLGRYINQVQECEKDLSILAQSTAIDSRWLLVLLASAMDGRMQDSNRKFIGNWVMRASLQQTPDFLHFFREDFIPWARQGSLFVSTLKRHNGQRRCLHGDRLSHYLRRLLSDSSQKREIVDSLVWHILHERDSIFAYAVAYILEGLKGALSDRQKQMLAQLTNLPEIARDFVRLQTTPHLCSQDQLDREARRCVAG